MTIRILLLAVSLSGCSEVVNTLSEFNPGLRASAATTLSDAPHVRVAIWTSWRGLDKNECPNFDEAELHATFGSIELSLESINYVFGEPAKTSDYCVVTFTAPEMMPSDGVVTVSDSSMEIVATFRPSALLMRGASHPTWSFARGETVSIRWSPPDDLDDSPMFPQLGLAPSGDSQLESLTLVAPDIVSFTIPLDYPVGPKDGRISFFSSEYDEPALTCVNAYECRAYQNRAVHFDAVVE